MKNWIKKIWNSIKDIAGLNNKQKEDYTATQNELNRPFEFFNSQEELGEHIFNFFDGPGEPLKSKEIRLINRNTNNENYPYAIAIFWAADADKDTTKALIDFAESKSTNKVIVKKYENNPNRIDILCSNQKLSMGIYSDIYDMHYYFKKEDKYNYKDKVGLAEVRNTLTEHDSSKFIYKITVDFGTAVSRDLIKEMSNKAQSIDEESSGKASYVLSSPSQFIIFFKDKDTAEKAQKELNECEKNFICGGLSK